MKKIIFILFVVFTVLSCGYSNAGYKQISKEEIMKSWAWKIFIFTDEGEIPIAQSSQNKSDMITGDMSIFADYIWYMKSDK